MAEINEKKDPVLKFPGRKVSEKEKEFLDQHGNPVPDDGEGKNDKAYPAKNTDNVLNARPHKETDMHNPPVKGGEKKPIQQGTSKLQDFSGFKGSQTSPNRGDNRQGDKTIVRKSESAVKPVKD